MMCCSEPAQTKRGGVAYEQRRWKGAGMEETPVEDGSLILAAVSVRPSAFTVCRPVRLRPNSPNKRTGIGRPHLNPIEGGCIWPASSAWLLGTFCSR